MVEPWLVDLMTSYNEESYSGREAYTAQVHLPGKVFADLVWWALQALPDEILVGLDVDAEIPHVEEVDERFSAKESTYNLFQGQGYRIKEAHIVNRLD